MEAGGLVVLMERAKVRSIGDASGYTHSGKERSTTPPPAMWLRMVKEVRQPRLRREMQRPFTVAGRPLFSGTTCVKGSNPSVILSKSTDHATRAPRRPLVMHAE